MVKIIKSVYEEKMNGNPYILFVCIDPLKEEHWKEKAVDRLQSIFEKRIEKGLKYVAKIQIIGARVLKEWERDPDLCITDYVIEETSSQSIFSAWVSRSPKGILSNPKVMDYATAVAILSYIPLLPIVYPQITTIPITEETRIRDVLVRGWPWIRIQYTGTVYPTSTLVLDSTLKKILKRFEKDAFQMAINSLEHCPELYDFHKIVKVIKETLITNPTFRHLSKVKIHVQADWLENVTISPITSDIDDLLRPPGYPSIPRAWSISYGREFVSHYPSKEVLYRRVILPLLYKGLQVWHHTGSPSPVEVLEKMREIFGIEPGPVEFCGYCTAPLNHLWYTYCPECGTPLKHFTNIECLAAMDDSSNVFSEFMPYITDEIREKFFEKIDDEEYGGNYEGWLKKQRKYAKAYIFRFREE